MNAQSIITRRWLLAFYCLLASLPTFAQQGPELLREAFSREFSIHVGGEQSPLVKDIASREVSLFVGAEPPSPYAQAISREMTMVVTTMAMPERITQLAITVSPTGDQATLNWCGYNELAQSDVVRYRIYSSTGPFTDVSGWTPDTLVPAGTCSVTISNLTAFQDHFFAVVAEDALGGFDPVVEYSAAYVLAPEAISREISLFVGDEPVPSYAQAISREMSLLVTTPTPPDRITQLTVTASPTGDQATLDWSAYNELAQIDIVHYDIYLSDAPFTSVSNLPRFTLVPAGTSSLVISNLPAFHDHYFAVVAVDGLGGFDPLVDYSASYVLAPEAVSREVSLFVGDTPLSGHPQAISREMTLLVPDEAVPDPVTGLETGFDALTSVSAFSAIDAFWPNYNELAQQDVTRYRLYLGREFFSDVSGMTPYTNAPAGASHWTVSGLLGGNIYHVAVVAEDVLGNFNPTVYSRSAKASPSQLGDIRSLAVVSSSDSLQFTWLAPEEAGAFLVGYRVYFAGAATPITLPPGTTRFDKDGLASAHGYTLRVTTLDIFGVESGGVQINAATWLPQPEVVAVQSFDGLVRLQWKHAEPNELVKHYAIYQSATSFSDVTGMTPVLTTRETRADLSGLVNGVPYFFAVTTVNISDGEYRAVQPVMATPNPVPGVFADLALTSLTSPASAYRGQPITVTWSVTNAGAGSTSTQDGTQVTTWTDRLVLSPDLIFGDANDIMLTNALHSGALEAGANYTTSASIQVPTSLFGLYHIFVLVNATGEVYEHLDLAANLGMANQPLQVTAAPPPVVLTQPQSQSVEAGRMVSLAVSASGTGTLSYQWYFAGNPVGGATAPTLTLTRTRLDQAGDYYVVVSDDLGSTQSATATLTVTPDTTAPMVAEFIPLGPIATSITNVQFRFSEAIQLESLTPDDVQVTTPSGLLDSSQIEIRRMNDLLFRAILPEQTADGNYRVQIGPEVFDLAGNAMAAGYEGSFTIDRTGPVLANLSLAGVPLAPGSLVRNSGILSIDASDGPEGSGVQRVEFYSDNQPIGADSNPADGFSVLWDLDLTPDGPHTLAVRAFDALGNVASQAVSVVVALAPPPPPVIVSPVDGMRINDHLIVLQGTTARNTTVVFYRNGVEVGARAPVTVSGVFEAPVPLLEGTNQIHVAAINRGGEGPKSLPLRIIVDRSVPAPPVALQARPREGGRILLDWVNPQSEWARGYHVYRATTRFTEPSQALRITPEPIAELSFADDVLPGDGTYFYAVSTVNAAGTEGLLSALAEAVSDATAPDALQVEYFPEGRFDPATGVYGTGPIRVELTMNEALLAPPFFSLTPSNGIPIIVNLTLVPSGVPHRYTGRLVVTAETPTGPAAVILSARDKVGNRGTTILEGATVLPLDTVGPQVVGLEVTPGSVIRNDAASPVTVVFTARLDSPLPAGTTPDFQYSLSLSQPEETPATAVEAGPDPLTWMVRVALSDSAGASTEELRLHFRGEDALQNIGTRIVPEHQFQVYQGDLPPLESPVGLIAKTRPAGRIQLSWQAVPEAVDYALYRRRSGETDFALLDRMGTVREWLDLPAEDGPYDYVVAAIRRENGQESLGEQSAVASAVSDRIPPGPPRQLTLQLASNGVFARWQPPSPVSETLSYGIVRAVAGPITTVETLEPLRGNIPTTQVVDPNPTPTEGFYAIYAEDTAGNRSLPSNTEYLNAQLLPVQNLTVVRHDTDAPVLTWTQPSPSATGYDIFLGPEDNRLRLTAAGPLSALTFTDTGYADDDRHYTVVTLDGTGHESLGRSLVLPAVHWELASDAVIRRGLMNRVEWDVHSRSAYALENARLVLTVGDRSHLSEAFRLEPGATERVGVVVGGYVDLPQGTVPVRVALENRPNEGELATLSTMESIATGDGQLLIGVLPADFTRGGSGKVQFSLLNPGDVEIEVLTARGGGVSPDIRFNLLDADGNLLSSAPFQAVVGPNIVNLSNGDAVLRLGPGAEALSPSFAIEVPTNAPNRLFVQVEIDRVYYHSDQPDRVEMQGLQTRTEVPVVDTTYTGVVTAVIPSDSLGDQVIQILGGAVLRSTGAPAPNVPLLVKIVNGGFERTDTVTTDAQGAFQTTFEPLPGESGGIYSVWAVHPDLRDRTVQKTFTIRRVVVSPGEFFVRAPFNFPQPLSLVAMAGPGTTATHLRLVARPEDQPSGSLPRDVTVDSGPVVETLAPGNSATLTPVITAGDNAAKASRLILALMSDDSPHPWQKLTANLEFDQATPVLRWSPSVVQTGVSPGSSVLAQINLENLGLVAAQEVKVELKSADGSPAPTWATLSSAATSPELAVGGRLEIGLNFQPGSTTPEDDYQFQVLISAANHPTKEVPALVAVSTSGRGDVLFNVVDMFTQQGADGNLVGGLAGASIYLQNELVESLETNRVTNAEGEAYFQNLPTGRYRYRITADRHHGVNGRIWVRPGITTTEQVALAFSLVTVEWEVVPITIEDRYEIVLQAEFETDVPAPVVVIEPAMVNLPQLFAGDIYYGEFSIQNHGLIRADDLSFELPPSDDYLEYELMAGLPDHLEAKQRLRVPYRIICKQTLPGPNSASNSSRLSAVEAGSLSRTLSKAPVIQVLGEGQARSNSSRGRVGRQGASGSSDCFTYATTCRCPYRYKCENGLTFTSAAFAGWQYSYTPGCSGGVGGGSVATFGGWTVESSGPSISHAGAPLFLDLCVPTLECGATGKCDTQCCDGRRSGHSWVDLLSREYRDEVTDLKVKIPGGEASVVRHFFRNSWQWADQARSLEFVQGADGLLKIRRWLIDYRPINTARTVFAYREIRITRETDGWVWENKDGDWEFYSPEGRLLSTGHRNLELTRFHYDEDGRLQSLADRTGQTIFTYFYEGDQLTSVRDLSGREVQYAFTHGRLTLCRDAAKNEMTYAYDGDGKMISKRDINGLELFISYQGGSQVASVLDRQGNGDFFQYFYDKNSRQYYTAVRTTGGETEEKWFNAQGRLIDQVRSGVPGDQIQFDGRNEIITKNTGVVWFRDYDEWGNLTREVRPDGGVVQTDYHPVFHRPVREVDPRGAITLWHYDTHGNLVERIEASGTEIARTNRWDYDDANRLIRSTDGRGNRLDYAYDASDNLIREFDPDQPAYQTFYGYDARGNRTALTNAFGYVTLYGYDALDRLIAETNALGHVTFYTYEGQNLVEVETGRENGNPGRLVRYRYDEHGWRTHTLRVDENDQEHLWEQTTYDAEGRVIATANALGQTTRYEYNAQGQRTRILRPFSATETSDIEYRYDDFGRLEREIDPLGVITRYEYDDLNRQRKVTEAVGTPVQRSRERGYDLAGNLVSITYSDGTNALTTLYTYDLLNRRTQIRGAREYPQDFEYDANDNLTAQINGRGYRTEHAYDPYNRRTNTVEGIFSLSRGAGEGRGEGSPGEHAASFDYDLLGRVVTAYDGNRNHHHYHHDALGRQTEQSIPLAPTNAAPAGEWWLDNAVVLTRTWFNPWGQPLATSNIVGGVTATIYDAFGHQFTHTDAAGLTLTNTYNALDQLVAIGYPVVSSAPAGSPPTSTRYAYDPVNAQMLLSTTDRANLTTRYGYDKRFQRTSDLSSWGALTTYQIDELGRQTAVTNALDEVTGSQFDQFDQLVATIYADHIPATQERIEYRAYDEYGRLTNHWGAATYDVAYAHDLAGNQVSLIDGNGNATQWEYDGRNRLVRTIYSNGTESHYTYDKNGNQTSKTDASGRITVYELSSFNHPTKITYSTGSSVIINHDNAGRLIQIDDNSGVSQWQYDTGNRIVATTQGYSKSSASYSYDSEGNRISLEVRIGIDRLPWMTRYEYGASGQLKTLYDSNISQSPFVYIWKDDAPWLEQLTFPTGLTISNAFDNVGGRTEMAIVGQHLDSQLKLKWQFSQPGKRITRDSQSEYNSYDYDSKGQLIRFARKQNANADQRELRSEFAYDSVGNLTKQIVDGNITTFTVNDVNQLVEMTSDYRQVFRHDENGNLIEGGGMVMEYDEENRLRAVRKGDQKKEFVYDGFGRRVGIKNYTGGDMSGEYRIIYDGMLSIAEIQVQSQTIESHTRGLDFSHTFDGAGGIGGILATCGVREPVYYILDDVGNTLLTVESNGAVLKQGSHNPFGMSMPGVETESGVRIGLNGKEADPLTGLVYFGGRYYNPVIMRWLTRDPLEENGGVNLYSFSQNDPVNLIDPWGLECIAKSVTDVDLEFYDFRFPPPKCRKGFEIAWNRVGVVDETCDQEASLCARVSGECQVLSMCCPKYEMKFRSEADICATIHFEVKTGIQYTNRYLSIIRWILFAKKANEVAEEARRRLEQALRARITFDQLCGKVAKAAPVRPCE